MNERRKARRNRPRAVRDLLLISLVALVVFWLGVVTGGFELAHRWVMRRFPTRVDEILVALGLATLGLWVFSLLRWRQARRETRARAAAEHRYRTLVEEMPAVTYVAESLHHEDGASKYIAPGIEQLLGFTPEQWLDDPDIWRKRIHPDDREAVMAESERTDQAGEPFSMEYRLIGRDGRVVWVRDDAVVMERGRPGRRSVWQGVLLDLTERKETEERLLEAENRYRSLVETIPAVTYVDRVDALSTTIFVSPQIEAMLGYTVEQWKEDLGLWMRALHPNDRNRVVDASARHNETGEPFDIEYRIRATDGRWLWVRDQATIVRDEQGRPRFSQGVMTDITDAKLAEEALREREQREREAAERLRALDEMKNAFLAAVSHELRSPLTSILGLALTLERQDMSKADRRDLLDRLASNARKLDKLLKDLLDIDRLSRGIVTPQYRPTDLGALVRRTVDSLEVPAGRRVLVDAKAVVVPADPPKVERIAENLLANAFRHGGPDATVWVHVREEDGGVLLAVEDDGPGVPRHLQKAIFEPFRQGPTASPHSPGTGIGLSLVAMFAELHGGKAWVEERDGGGASFRVFLPMVPPQWAADEELETPSLDATSTG